MTDIELLMTDPMPAHVQAALADRFCIHKLWEIEDQDRWFQRSAAEIRGLVCGGHTPIDGPFIRRFANLEIIASFGVGYDSIDAVEAAKANVVVTNTPDVLTDEVADTAIGLLVMTARELSAAERWLRAGKWESAYPLSAGTLRNRKLGIFGLGRIGKAIGRRAESMGLEIGYHNRSEQADVSYLYHSSLLALAQWCDILLCVAPGGAATRHAVNAETLKALGSNGILINIGRGSVVDEAALIEALQNKTILSAGLDVFENEPHVPDALIAMDHVVLLPHLGSASVHTRQAMGQLQVDNLTGWFQDGSLLTPVVETPWPRDSGTAGQ